jgi:hypothetical protein
VLIGAVGAKRQRPSSPFSPAALLSTVQCGGAVTENSIGAFRSGWSKQANTRGASSGPHCVATYTAPSAGSVNRCMPSPVREYGMSASTRSSFSAARPGSGRRPSRRDAESSDRPFSTALTSREGRNSTKVSAPDPAPNRMTVSEPNT